MNLGTVLYEWRYGKRISRADAAKIMRVPESTLAQLESGKDVTGANLAKVLAWLLAESPAPADQPQQLQLEGPRAAG